MQKNKTGHLSYWCCLVPKLGLILLQPMDTSLPGSSVYGISQARILEWVAISWPAYRFLKRQVRWSGITISFRIFQFILLYASFGNCPNKYYILKFIPSNIVLGCLGRVWLFMTPWTLACQAPLSMGFSREEYWIGLPCPPLGDLPGPWIRPTSHISCIGRRILYYYCHLGSDTIDVVYFYC